MFRTAAPGERGGHHGPPRRVLAMPVSTGDPPDQAGAGLRE